MLVLRQQVCCAGFLFVDLTLVCRTVAAIYAICLVIHFFLQCLPTLLLPARWLCCCLPPLLPASPAGLLSLRLSLLLAACVNPGCQNYFQDNSIFLIHSRLLFFSFLFAFLLLLFQSTVPSQNPSSQCPKLLRGNTHLPVGQ